MRVGIDIRKYYDYGIGTYIQNLAHTFEERSDLSCVYFIPDEYRSRITTSLRGEFVSENSSKYSLKELISVSENANAQQLDLFHAPHYTLPINLKMPSIVTIHDIIHLRLKQYFSLPKRAYAYWMIRHACKASSAVIVDSEFGKKELMQVFNIREEKIRVVPLGVNQLYFEKTNEEEKERIRKKYEITKPYILYTGSVKPHKNIPTLLRAFKKILIHNDMQLVFTGENLLLNPSLVAIVQDLQLKKSVIDLGRIGIEELKTVYQSASVVVLPSFYEGFGFSMLEGMASRVPVIGARATSITEVVGDAGLLFDPSDENELAKQLESLFSNSMLRSELINKGVERAKKYTWKNCAEKTLKIYHEVAK